MAETDPYETSYGKHVPKLSEAAQRVAAKRLRKQANAKGNRARDEFEAKAPNWKNEPNQTSSTAPRGSNTPFQPGSFPGGLHFNMKKDGRKLS